jgi:hypothetical protein
LSCCPPIWMRCPSSDTIIPKVLWRSTGTCTAISCSLPTE